MGISFRLGGGSDGLVERRVGDGLFLTLSVDFCIRNLLDGVRYFQLGTLVGLLVQRDGCAREGQFVPYRYRTWSQPGVSAR